MTYTVIVRGCFAFAVNLMLSMLLMASLQFSAVADELPEVIPPLPIEDEQVSLEDGRIVKDLDTWLQTLEYTAADNSKPKAAEEKEFLSNWINTTKTNIERLSKRKSASKKKLDDYAFDTQDDFFDLGRYMSLKDLHASWEDLRGKPGGLEEIEKQRQRLVSSQNQLLAPGGIDPSLLFEKIAKESRPEPIKLDDVQLVLSFKPKKTETEAAKPDFWPKIDNPIEVNLTNTGDDASTYTWTMFDTIIELGFPDHLTNVVTSNSMSCRNAGGKGSARCETTSLEARETKTFQMMPRLEDLDLDDLDDAQRIKVSLIARATSEEPYAVAEDKKLKLSFRYCVSAYRKELDDAGLYLHSSEARKKYERAIGPISGLKGKSLFKYKDRFLDRIGLPNKGYLIRQAIKYRGPDNLLYDLYTGQKPGQPLAYGRSLHRRMQHQSVPKQMCARPHLEIERIRALLSAQKAIVDEFADALSNAAQKRAQGFRTSMSEGLAAMRQMRSLRVSQRIVHLTERGFWVKNSHFGWVTPQKQPAMFPKPSASSVSSIHFIPFIKVWSHLTRQSQRKHILGER